MRINSYPSLLVALFIGLIAALFFGSIFYDLETKSIKTEFQRDVINHSLSIEKELVFNSEPLFALQGFFDNSTKVTKQEFQYFTRSILQRHSSIHALSWVPQITEIDVKNSQQYYSFHDDKFKLFQRDADKELLNVPNKQRYYPVTFIEPLLGNEAAVGYDLSSNAVRLAALISAQQTGQFTATANITLVQETAQQKGILAILPVYTKTSDSANNHSKDIDGFVTAVYRVNDLIDKALSSNKITNIQLNVIDSTDHASELLYQKKPKTGAVHPINYSHKIEPFGTRNWLINAQPSKHYVSSKRSHNPTVIFILMLTFFSSSFAYIFKLSRQSEITEKIVGERTKELIETKQTLERITLLDELTGIANRRHFDTYLLKEWARALRHQVPLTLIIIDIDFFKQFNDNYGHLAGDACLEKVAQNLDKTVQRSTDLLARYGGEEFAIIAPNTADGYILAELCRKQIEDTNIPHAYSNIANHITITIGYSTLTPSRDNKPDDLFKLADEALYKAKASGRNQSQSA